MIKESKNKEVTIIITTILLALATLGSLLYFVDRIGRNGSEGTLENPQFYYGSDVIINKGFYKNFTCVVINEYKDSVFCHLQRFKDGEHFVKIQEKYQIHVNVNKSDIEELVD